MNKRMNAKSRKQRAPSEKRGQIARSAIEIIATHGMDGLTHRHVAKAAGVSVGLTTYYFENKSDIIAEASRVTLRHYEDRSNSILSAVINHSSNISDLRAFVLNLVLNHAHESRSFSLCWFDIVLSCKDYIEQSIIEPEWFNLFISLWIEIGAASGKALTSLETSSVVDVVIGLSMMAISLGLTPDQIKDVLNEGHDPLLVWAIPSDPLDSDPIKIRSRSSETHNRIVEATIDILVTKGVGAVVYRSVAEEAGLTLGGPFYHFPKIQGLIYAARSKLLVDCRSRRDIEISERAKSLDYLADFMTMIFLREITEFISQNIANYITWTEAGRDTQLRSIMWQVISKGIANWKELLDKCFPNARNIDSVILEAIFVGKFIRLLGTGVRDEDLVNIRRQFRHDLDALMSGSFWM